MGQVSLEFSIDVDVDLCAHPCDYLDVQCSFNQGKQYSLHDAIKKTWSIQLPGELV